MGMFIREKKIHCGKEHMEVDIYQLGDAHKKKANQEKENRLQHLHKRISMTKEREDTCAN